MATLSYAYADSEVWIEVLTEESHPMTHDLCGMHADAVRVPRGWALNDVRAASDATSGEQPVGQQAVDGVALRLVGA